MLPCNNNNQVVRLFFPFISQQSLGCKTEEVSQRTTCVRVMQIFANSSFPPTKLVARGTIGFICEPWSDALGGIILQIL